VLFVDTFCAALILTGVAVGVVALIALHLLPTGLSPLRNAVSQYGISRYRGGYRVQTIGFGVAGAGAAAGLASFAAPDAVLVGLCALFAASRLAISWYPMDEPGRPLTSTGRAHGLLAICAFGGIDVAAEQLSKVLNRNHVEAGFATASAVAAILMLACFVAMTVNRRTAGGLFGLCERFYLCMTAWLVLVAALLLVHP
jgi:hypothetical protein